jgi:hypothetical protein
MDFLYKQKNYFNALISITIDFINFNIYIVCSRYKIYRCYKMLYIGYSN